MTGLSSEQDAQPRSVTEIPVDGHLLRYFTPNRTARWRCETLFTKEPCTIEWLRRLRPGDVLLDVGANVGMYTVFAAAAKGATVYAFEPESQNFAALVKNIVLNDLQGRVLPYCAALSDANRLDRLYLSRFEWDGAGSLHSFGADVGHDLQPRSAGFVQGCISFTIDEAVRLGAIAQPRFLKLDVDGFEHKVVAGAMETLANPVLESLCIEINTTLPEHRALLETLSRLGFRFDPGQVERVLRREGPFQGCAEFIFERAAAPVALQVESPFSPGEIPARAADRHAQAFDHLLRRVADTPVAQEPFPHAVVDDLFPQDYYRELLAHFPPESALVPLAETGRITGDAYRERRVLLFNGADFARLAPASRAFWSEFSSWLYSERFLRTMIERFLPWCRDRLAAVRGPQGAVRVRSDALLVGDRTRYAIGPHTDAAHRLITFLFYLPQDRRDEGLGTSIYRHRDPGFSCRGGPHYPFDGFERVRTIGFVPNRLLMFVRTSRSFHGVEPILGEGVDRRLLINNVRLVEAGA